MLFIVQSIRTILFYLLLGSFTILWSTLLFFIIPFISINRGHKFLVKYWSITALWLAQLTCGIHYKIHGIENIPKYPCVIISNHQSVWETFFLQTAFTPQSQVIKKELLTIPFFGWAFRLIKPIAINRDDPQAALQAVITQGLIALKDGRWVLIFPEGTRRPNGKLGKFSKGGVNLAKKAAVSILPIAHNAAVCWPIHSFLTKPGTIHLYIGKPIKTDEQTVLEINNKIYNWIKNTLQSINDISKKL